jgi:hypothetical protein
MGDRHNKHLNQFIIYRIDYPALLNGAMTRRSQFWVERTFARYSTREFISGFSTADYPVVPNTVAIIACIISLEGFDVRV